MQQHTGGQHVALRGLAVAAQRDGLRRARGVGGSGRRGHLRRHGGASQADLPTVGHQGHVGLQVVVGHTRFMGEGQALQDLRHQGRGLGAGQAFGRGPFDQRGAVAWVVGDKRPAVLHTHLDHGGQVGVVQARGLAGDLLPVLQPGRVGRLHARQHDDQFLLVARVGHAPGHGAFAFAQQTQQLHAAEGAHGVRARRGGRSGAGCDHGPGIEPRTQRRDGPNSGGNGRLFALGQASTTRPWPVMKAPRTRSPGCSACTACT